MKNVLLDDDDEVDGLIVDVDVTDDEIEIAMIDMGVMLLLVEVDDDELETEKNDIHDDDECLY